MPDTATMAAQDDHRTPVKIIVDGRFAPHTVVLTTGRAHRLVFRREETNACSDHVVFPSLGRSTALPPFADIGVDLPALEPGSYPMTCRNGALYGRILVRPDRVRPH